MQMVWGRMLKVRRDVERRWKEQGKMMRRREMVTKELEFWEY